MEKLGNWKFIIFSFLEHFEHFWKFFLVNFQPTKVKEICLKSWKINLELTMIHWMERVLLKL